MKESQSAAVDGSLIKIRSDLLPPTTVRISIKGRGATGTGFFVAPEIVVTCKHVLKPLDLAADEAPSLIEIEGCDGKPYEVEAIRHVSPDDVEDLAVLRVAPAKGKPVLLFSGLNPSDVVAGFGYTDPHPEGVPVTLVGEGLTGDKKLFRLREGQVEHGMSGAPVLNMRTGAVCGVLKRTRDARQALGGYAIPITTLYELAGPVQTGNRAAHSGESPWIELLPEETRQVWRGGRATEPGSGPPDCVVVVTVEKQRDLWQVTAEKHPRGEEPPDPIGPIPVDLNKVRREVARLFRDWASPDSTWRGRVKRGEELELLGTILSTAVFPGKIGQMIADDVLSERGEGWTEIALRFEADPEADRDYQHWQQDLDYLPWEHLYLPPTPKTRATYFARETGIAFTRARSRGVRTHRAPQSPREVSIALIPADPPGATEYEDDISREIRQVVADASNALADKRVRLSVAESSDPSMLIDWLSERKPHVVHYVGFGGFHAGRDEIAFCHGRKISYVGAGVFAEMIADARPRVVVLQLCDADSRMIPVRADLTPFAPDVLGMGVEALVAYQYPARASDIGHFNEHFYKKLIAGTTVEMAVQSARRLLHFKNTEGREGRTFLAPTVCVAEPGGLTLTAPATEVASRSYVAPGMGYG